MIPINRIFERVKDLSKKDQAGYTDPDEFNRNIRDAEHWLLSFYIRQLEKTQLIPESITPFITRSPELTVTDNIIARPSDMRFLLEVYAGEFYIDGCDTKKRTSVAEYVGQDEVGAVIDSKIRLSQRYYYEGNTIRLVRDGSHFAVLRYVRNPIVGVYNYTIDVDNDLILFDANTSANCEWMEYDEGNLVDILLFMKGIETRDTALIQYVSGKKEMYG